MNLKNIELIITNDALPDDVKRKLIYAELAKDESAITTILRILGFEREEKKELIMDLNALLSKAHLGLEQPKVNKDGFMQKEIREFYKSGRIGHCFANMDK